MRGSFFCPPHQVHIYQNKVGVAIPEQIDIRAKAFLEIKGCGDHCFTDHMLVK